ncbi:MAG: Efflux ABC transporter, ATP-binding protein [Olavius algarvensis Gamma 3 endosymbiont]|nr:MAG: Efflux ABC transporter, ATP-binding protein [Olavius algarvensis Gamma 3 endosymbiont]
MQPIVKIQSLSKVYQGGQQALKAIDLDINEGEILALLGPNGAGKTTLISIICGIVSGSSGSISVAGHDIVSDYRVTRGLIGLVPQELTLGAFDTVWNTVNFSRGLFGKKPNPAYLEQLLKDLSLWDKRDSELRALSGGMKRRVLIAKALSHEPRILFLDEPTAGVDVELRQDMWRLVRRMNDSGVTIILTTHYIEEAEEIADRVGIINGGELLLVDDKHRLMRKLGKKVLQIELKHSIDELPAALADYNLEATEDGRHLVYTYDTDRERTGITALLQTLNELGLSLKDIKTSQSSLEEIFVKLVSSR